MAISRVVAPVSTLVACIAIGIGGAVSGTAFVFDSMNWCCFHSWALLHGTGTVVFLKWAYLGFHIVTILMKASGQFAPVPNLAFVCSALDKLIFTEYFMWPGLLLSGVGVYRRIRHACRAAAGLTWAAVFVSVLNLAFWLYLTILFASIQDSTPAIDSCGGHLTFTGPGQRQQTDSQ